MFVWIGEWALLGVLSTVTEYIKIFIASGILYLITGKKVSKFEKLMLTLPYLL